MLLRRKSLTDEAIDLRWSSWFMVILMGVGVLALYCPISLFLSGQSLLGLDYVTLHEHRLRYAREYLFSAGILPGWYTREFFGTPFWSNIHSFPWNLNRLVLLVFDPSVAYAVAVNLSALIAGISTYFYCRAMGVSKIFSLVSGWTFIAAGFFSSRVLAGHLPVLEAYYALPCLLWVLEWWAQSQHKFALVFYAFVTAHISLSGHPQIPAYALLTALIYAFFHRQRIPWKRVLLATLLGAGLTLFVWWPMAELIMRSSRMLLLDVPYNDVSFSFHNLLLFLFPWKNGWPDLIERANIPAFQNYSDAAQFWDTVCYMGWLPMLSLLVLPFIMTKSKAKRHRIIGFWMGMGLFFLLAAFPWSSLMGLEGGITLFRSSSRQLYITTFALSFLVGMVLEQIWILIKTKKFLALCVLSGLLVFHFFDLGRFSRSFIRGNPVDKIHVPEIENKLKTVDMAHRVAIDYKFNLSFNRQYDDIGFFDAIALADPYKTLFSLSGYPPKTNHESFSGEILNSDLLSDLGVKYVLTIEQRDDMKLENSSRGFYLYSLPDPRERVLFVPAKAIQRRGDGTVGADVSQALHPSPQIDRESPDKISIRIHASEPGFLVILEAWDRGWQPRVHSISSKPTTDLKPVFSSNGPHLLLRANGFIQALELQPGDYAVDLIYRTPGVWSGVFLSSFSLVILILVYWRGRRDPFCRDSRIPRGLHSRF